MRLHDEGLEFLIELVDENKTSHRELARAAGYDAHSYIGRLLKGQARTLSTDAAMGIAKYYGVKPHRLFLTEVTFADGPNVPKTGTKGQRGGKRKASNRPSSKAA